MKANTILPFDPDRSNKKPTTKKAAKKKEPCQKKSDPAPKKMLISTKFKSQDPKNKTGISSYFAKPLSTSEVNEGQDQEVPMEVDTPPVEPQVMNPEEIQESDNEDNPVQHLEVDSGDEDSQENYFMMIDTKAGKKGEDMDQKVFENCMFTVFDIAKESIGTCLVLKSFDDDNVPLHFKVTLRGLWQKTPIDHGDIVRIIGKFTKQNKYTLALDDQVENDEINPETNAYFLILEPNTLISTTSIISSFPCVRKSIFADQFKSNVGEYDYYFVLGNILHEAFEKIVCDRRINKHNLREVFMEVLKGFYAQIKSLKAPLETVLKDLDNSMSYVFDWLDKFEDYNLNDLSIRVIEPIGTEQEFNSALYGVKGKLDATLKTSSQLNPEKEVITALELKTGRENRTYQGQVILYGLLIAERFQNASDKHILLYLKPSEPSAYYHVATIRGYVCQLVNRRNELAKLQKITSQGKIYDLPKILNREVCKTCFVSEVCTYYSCAFENQDIKNPVFTDYLEIKSRADERSLDYFRRWYNLIQTEQNSHSFGNTYQFNNIERKLVRDEGLKIFKIEKLDDREIHIWLKKEFQKKKNSVEISVNSYVNLSSQKSINFTKGIVLGKRLYTEDPEPNSEDEDDSCFTFQKNKKKSQKQIIEYQVQYWNINMINFTKDALGGFEYTELDWTLEAESFQVFLFNVMRNNLQSLCISKDKVYLRESIIYNDKPEYSLEDISFEDEYKEFLEELNDEQVKALKKCITCKDYQMILGVPASGKTLVIALLILILKKRKEKMLLMGINNKAIDNIIMRVQKIEEKLQIQDKVVFVRMTGNKSQVNKKLQYLCDSCTRFDSAEHLDQFIANTDVLATNIMSINNTFFCCVIFDYSIVIEASLVVEPLALGPVVLGKKFVMVGDYYIYNPVVKSYEAERGGFSISLFRRLVEQYPYDAVVLCRQYRMNDDIQNLSNTIAYKGLIKKGKDEQYHSQGYHFNVNLEKLSWQTQVMKPDRKVMFINIDNILNKTLSKKLTVMKNRNFFEAAIINDLLDKFIEGGAKPNHIGIITPLSDQLNMIQSEIRATKVKVFPLDKIQGLSKPIIIISTVKHSKKVSAKEIRKIYTCFNHAEQKLIILGSIANLKEVEPICQFINFIKKKNWYIELNNVVQIKKYFPKAAQKHFSFLKNEKPEGLSTVRNPINGAYLGSNKNFADDNQIFYHIDGVATTHTGVPKAKANEP